MTEQKYDMDFIFDWTEKSQYIEPITTKKTLENLNEQSTEEEEIKIKKDYKIDDYLKGVVEKQAEAN